MNRRMESCDKYCLPAQYFAGNLDIKKQQGLFMLWRGNLEFQNLGRNLENFRSFSNYSAKTLQHSETTPVTPLEGDCLGWSRKPEKEQ